MSAVAHELLIALSNDNVDLFASSLHWPPTMIDGIHESLSTIDKAATFMRFTFTTFYQYMTNAWATARIPLVGIDFPLVDMPGHCHTELTHGILDKEETPKLAERLRREDVPITSAISSGKSIWIFYDNIDRCWSNSSETISEVIRCICLLPY